MITAALFDVDGVLLDTVPYHFEAWRRMCADHGKTITFEDYLEKLNGLPRLTGIKNVFPDKTDEELEHLAALKQAYFTSAIDERPPTPLAGVVKLLEIFKSMSIVCAAASSSKNAPALLKNANLSQYFEVIIGGNDFKEPKPSPDIFLTAATLLGESPRGCVVFEDATIGIHAAKNASMKSIGLTRSKDPDIADAADVSIDSLNDHREILSHISSFNSHA